MKYARILISAFAIALQVSASPAHATPAHTDTSLCLSIELEAQSGYSRFVGPEKNFYINLPTGKKAVHILRQDSWGDTRGMEGKSYEVGISVRSREEAAAIFDQIAKEFEKNHGPPLVHKLGGMVFEIPDMLCAEIRSANPGNQRIPGTPFLELKIQIPSKPQKAAHSKTLMKSLLGLGLSEAQSRDEIGVDLNHNSGRREWAYYSFYHWGKALTFEERNALRALAGYEYRIINEYLRDQTSESQNPGSKVEMQIKDADQALQKSSLDRDITVYRSDPAPEWAAVWQKLQTTNDTASVQCPVDKAYTFTTLDPEVSTWWNSHTHGNKGVQLEIEVPSGSRAAYLDAQGVETDRGFLEIMLPRKSQFVTKKAYTDAQGRRVLRVTLKP